ncbi:helix-turn-helix domain-containing protein [Chelativorans sp. YIM 93263]|uniref:helix-turn-helix domain-containing protein n=1 Tax=Chelativorans sp. YIM 93263 TaxID=2906648 RepID=UPI002379C1BC|nr:AraC family transcriptional regulator [Chelativorans sp. YIM 93263]
MQSHYGSSDRRVEEMRRSAHAQALDLIPENAGPRASTCRGGAVYSVREPGSQEFLSESHFAAVMLAPCRGIEAAIASDSMRRFDAPVGMIIVNPANVDSRTKWHAMRENAVVAIGPESLQELAEQEFDRTGLELQAPPFGTIDPTALRIAEMLKAELSGHEPTSEFYIDSLVTLFGIHLLRNYTNIQGSTSKVAGGLSLRAARRIDEFLHENFARKLAVADLAAICELSPGHFIQAFAKTFGISPHQYLLNLRLARAEKMLVETELTIAAIAYLTGFSSQSHLTSAMRKHKGLTPALLRSRRI